MKEGRTEGAGGGECKEDRGEGCRKFNSRRNPSVWERSKAVKDREGKRGC